MSTRGMAVLWQQLCEQVDPARVVDTGLGPLGRSQRSSLLKASSPAPHLPVSF